MEEQGSAQRFLLVQYLARFNSQRTVPGSCSIEQQQQPALHPRAILLAALAAAT
jgi:hypothetical protein